jgi:hypothetical protein
MAKDEARTSHRAMQIRSASNPAEGTVTGILDGGHARCSDWNGALAAEPPVSVGIGLKRVSVDIRTGLCFASGNSAGKRFGEARDRGTCFGDDGRFGVKETGLPRVSVGTDWTPERITRQAGEIGRNTSALVEIILRERTHPEQGFRACVGILWLVKTYGRERLEAACSRALEIGARSYSSVNSILKNNLDRQRPAKPADGPAIAHDNIRGPTYFH